MTAQLEHTHYTVSDPAATAAWMTVVFGWHIRWQGPAGQGGQTVHVGTDDQYLALYKPQDTPAPHDGSYDRIGALNHIAVVVDDLPATRAAVQRAGFTPGELQDYDPGHRFYFHDNDGVEYEVVHYD